MRLTDDNRWALARSIVLGVVTGDDKVGEEIALAKAKIDKALDEDNSPSPWAADSLTLDERVIVNAIRKRIDPAIRDAAPHTTADNLQTAPVRLLAIIDRLSKPGAADGGGHIPLLLDAAREIKALVETMPEAQEVGGELWTAMHRLDVALRPETVGGSATPPLSTSTRGEISRVRGASEGGRGYEVHVRVDKEPGAAIPPEHMPGRSVVMSATPLPLTFDELRAVIREETSSSDRIVRVAVGTINRHVGDLALKMPSATPLPSATDTDPLIEDAERQATRLSAGMEPEPGHDVGGILRALVFALQCAREAAADGVALREVARPIAVWARATLEMRDDVRPESIALDARAGTTRAVVTHGDLAAFVVAIHATPPPSPPRFRLPPAWWPPEGVANVPQSVAGPWALAHSAVEAANDGKNARADECLRELWAALTVSTPPPSPTFADGIEAAAKRVGHLVDAADREMAADGASALRSAQAEICALKPSATGAVIAPDILSALVDACETHPDDAALAAAVEAMRKGATGAVKGRVEEWWHDGTEARIAVRLEYDARIEVGSTVTVAPAGGEG